MTFAFISDLHNAPYDDALQAARGVDAILVTGDLLDRHRGGM
ncbi:MAG: metallophosphoesterase, partial [Clostridia bacterium]|nr:metallophosphoesterase [Clostridia bacterium]